MSKIFIAVVLAPSRTGRYNADVAVFVKFLIVVRSFRFSVCVVVLELRIYIHAYMKIISL